MHVCPQCQSDRLVNNGSVAGKPKKLCKQCGFQFELVASFANRSNLLKSWEKTDTCEVSSYGAHGLKKRSDHAHARPMLCHGVPRIFLTVPLSYGAVAYTVAKARNVCAP
jgi:hypothetical protein